MWNARGTILGLPGQELVWDGGPLGWPQLVLTLTADLIAAGEQVRYTPTGPVEPLNLDDELTVAVWLNQQGMTLTGDLPAAPDAPDVPDDVIA